MLVGNGWAFIHIPKCGGAAVRSVLSGWECVDVLPLFPRNTVSHGFHWVAKDVHPGSFTFVRHPVTWLASYWSERGKEFLHDQESVRISIQLLDRLWSPDPDLFLARVAYNLPGYVGELFDAYAAYAVSVHRLEDGIAPVLSKLLGVDHVHVQTKNAGWSPKVSDRASRLIMASEKAAIEKYGYA